MGEKVIELGSRRRDTDGHLPQRTKPGGRAGETVDFLRLLIEKRIKEALSKGELEQFCEALLYGEITLEDIAVKSQTPEKDLRQIIDNLPAFFKSQRYRFLTGGNEPIFEHVITEQKLRIAYGNFLAGEVRRIKLNPGNLKPNLVDLKIMNWLREMEAKMRRVEKFILGNTLSGSAYANALREECFGDGKIAVCPDPDKYLPFLEEKLAHLGQLVDQFVQDVEQKERFRGVVEGVVQGGAVHRSSDPTDKGTDLKILKPAPVIVLPEETGLLARFRDALKRATNPKN